MPALAPNSLIAISGITGYIASYTGLCALHAGHRVRGTVRSMARAESLKAAYEKQGVPVDELEKRLEFVIVDDLNSEEQWTKALEGVDGVLHGALALTEFSDPKLVDIAIEGTLPLLRAAKKFPSIKRVVLTSSVVTIHTPGILCDRVLSPQDWNDEAVKIFENNLPVDHDPALKRAAPILPYAVAKLKAERAAWDFVKQEKVCLDNNLSRRTYTERRFTSLHSI
jgi:nucleoside-diphosphate-sugar epimerase